MRDPKCVFSFAANMEFVSSPDFLVQGENIWICDESLSSLFSTCYHPALEAFVLLCPSNSSLPPKVSHWKSTKIKGLGLASQNLDIHFWHPQSLRIPSDTKYCFKYRPDLVSALASSLKRRDELVHSVVTSADIHFAFCLCLHKGAGLLSVVKAWRVE